MPTLLLVCTIAAHALSEDRDRPLQVSAAAVDYSEKTGVTVYRGNVVLVQGSLRIEADRMETRNHAGQIDTVTAQGKPVRVRSLLDRREQELRVDADQLVYHAGARELELSGNVWLRQGGDEIRAAQVRYTIDAKRLIATGADTTDGRVRGVIQPRAARPAP